MTESHEQDAHHEDEHHGPNLKLYMTIFVVLSVCTGLSFALNSIFADSPGMKLTTIMLVSIVKAVCVGAIFMHLKWDWSNLYFMIIPAFILGVLMMIVLMPDIVLAW